MVARHHRRYRERPSLDPNAVRYFVYFALDAAGKPLYIGRSCDVAARLRAHHGTLTHRGLRSAEWLLDTRSIAMTGPYAWDDAVREERNQIERHQPVGNISLTARDHRPGIARRSASRAVA